MEKTDILCNTYEMYFNIVTVIHADLKEAYSSPLSPHTVIPYSPRHVNYSQVSTTHHYVF
jgi:hypothetical protein